MIKISNVSVVFLSVAANIDESQQTFFVRVKDEHRLIGGQMLSVSALSLNWCMFIPCGVLIADYMILL